MPRISRDVVSALLSRIDLVELVERTVTLKKSGSVYKGLCPFHSERTASFCVWSDHMHCFSCGVHGNAITWVMEMQGLKFPDAVEALAKGAAFDLGAKPPPLDDSGRKKRERRQNWLQEQARIEAQELLAACDRQRHPYLCRKGFPAVLGLVHLETGDLLIPMRDFKDYDVVNSLQRIDGEGAKKFLYGGKAKGSVFKIGSGKATVLVEGYVTALSVQAALKHLHQTASVLVCFSADNLAHIASMVKRPSAFIFCDNDESGVGEKAAKSTGLPYCIAPRPDGVKKVDANDWHIAKGVKAVADLIREAQDKAAGY